MAWIYLLIAALFEVGWPTGLKLAQVLPAARYFWLLFAVITMTISGVLLFLAQKQIPIGSAYAIWTGIGTIGTFLVGVLFFHDSISLMRFLGVLLILSGVIVLKLLH